MSVNDELDSAMRDFWSMIESKPKPQPTPQQRIVVESYSMDEFNRKFKQQGKVSTIRLRSPNAGNTDAN